MSFHLRSPEADDIVAEHQSLNAERECLTQESSREVPA